MSNINRRKTIKILGTIGLTSFLPLRLFGEIVNQGGDVCKLAWKNLSKFNAKRYQFRYIEPIEGLPKIFIYGDSISIGYTEYVRAALEGKAFVCRLHVNGGSSHDFITKMESFRKAMFQPDLKEGWDFEWDVIHFNIGLHDLKYIFDKKLDLEKGKQVSTPDVYKKNLHTIINYLKIQYPKSKLIFATTTPVPEGGPGRKAGDAKKFNKKALKVMKGYKDIAINDLYRFSIPVLEKYGIEPGDVHYKDEGSRLQGIEVAQVIGDAIGVKPADCPSVEIIKELFKEYEGSIDS